MTFISFYISGNCLNNLIFHFNHLIPHLVWQTFLFVIFQHPLFNFQSSLNIFQPVHLNLDMGVVSVRIQPMLVNKPMLISQWFVEAYLNNFHDCARFTKDVYQFPYHGDEISKSDTFHMYNHNHFSRLQSIFSTQSHNNSHVIFNTKCISLQSCIWTCVFFDNCIMFDSLTFVDQLF